MSHEDKNYERVSKLQTNKSFLVAAVRGSLPTIFAKNFGKETNSVQ